MKKIGILTFHRSVNNGAVMQAYSLSARLAKEYPDVKVEIIDYHMQKVTDLYHYSMAKYIKSDNIKFTINRMFQLLFNPFQIKRLNQRTEIFKKALKKLPLSNFTIIEDSPEKLFEKINQEYDVLIVGSDAIWNYVIRGFPNAYFPDKRVKCFKMSYAASCYGMDFTTIEDATRLKIGNILSDFEFVGVRDYATEDFVRWSGCKAEPVHTCDPTAFLDIDSLPIDEEFVKEKLKKRGFDFSRPTIGIMGNEKMCHMVRTFYGKEYQIVALYDYVHGADVNLYDLEPFEWAYVFRFFKLTFTTYFHGTLLSLRNGVPLICVALDTPFAKKHIPKTLDLLQRLGYSDWYFKTDYVSKNFDIIKAKADELLITSNREEILDKLDKEAESYCVFQNALTALVRGGVE